MPFLEINRKSWRSSAASESARHQQLASQQHAAVPSPASTRASRTDTDSGQSAGVMADLEGHAQLVYGTSCPREPV